MSDADDGRAVSTNSRVTIGLVLAVIGGVVTPIWTQATLNARVATLEKDADNHARLDAHPGAALRLERLRADIAHHQGSAAQCAQDHDALVRLQRQVDDLARRADRSDDQRADWLRWFGRSRPRGGGAGGDGAGDVRP